MKQFRKHCIIRNQHASATNRNDTRSTCESTAESKLCPHYAQLQGQNGTYNDPGYAFIDVKLLQTVIVSNSFYTEYRGTLALVVNTMYCVFGNGDPHNYHL